MLHLHSELTDLQETVRSKVEDLEGNMLKLERESQIRMDQIMDGDLEEVVHEAKSVFTRRGSERKDDVEKELFEKRHPCEQKLRQSERELKDIDQSLSNIPVRERHFGDLVSKNSAATLPRFFCRAIEKHPSVRRVNKRLKSITSTKACSICIEICTSWRPCANRTFCFYCNQVRPHEKVDNHTSICSRPEQFMEAHRKHREHTQSTSTDR